MFYLILSYTDDANPILDAITTGTGIVATYLMAAKKVEAWVVWLVDDLIRVYMYYTLETPTLGLTCLNFFWVFMAVGSCILWYKDYKKYNQER